MHRLALLSALCACLLQTGAVERRSIAITDVTVIDVHRGAEVRHQNIVIADGRILSVTPASTQVSSGSVVISGKGKYLIPGLWDMHIHLADDAPALGLLLAAGITGARDMGTDPKKALEMRKRIQSGAVDGPRLFVAGPMLAGPPSEAADDTWIVRTPEEGRKAVAELASLGVDFIKVHDHLSAATYKAIAESSKAIGIPFAGHVTEHVTPVEASIMGQRSIEHFEFLPKRCLALFDPEPVAPAAGCDSASLNSILKTLATNGTWLDPTVQPFQFFAPERWPKIRAVYRGLAALMRADGVRTLTGTDQSRYLKSKGSVPGMSLHEELALSVDSGFTAIQALRAATEESANFLGASATTGTIGVGKSADLVLLDGNPLLDINNTKRIVAVLSRGRLYDSAGIKRLRKINP